MNSKNIMTLTIADASKSQEVKEIIADIIMKEYAPYELEEAKTTIDNLRIEGATILLDEADGGIIPEELNDEFYAILRTVATTFKDMPFECQASTYMSYEVKYENRVIQIDYSYYPMGRILMDDDTPEDDEVVVDIGSCIIAFSSHDEEEEEPIRGSSTIIIS